MKKTCVEVQRHVSMFKRTPQKGAPWAGECRIAVWHYPACGASFYDVLQHLKFYLVQHNILQPIHNILQASKFRKCILNQIISAKLRTVVMLNSW